MNLFQKLQRYRNHLVAGAMLSGLIGVEGWAVGKLVELHQQHQVLEQFIQRNGLNNRYREKVLKNKGGLRWECYDDGAVVLEDKIFDYLAFDEQGDGKIDDSIRYRLGENAQVIPPNEIPHHRPLQYLEKLLQKKDCQRWIRKDQRLHPQRTPQADGHKYALIINGDSELRHVDNVREAYGTLAAHGYSTTIVTNQAGELQKLAKVYSATEENVRQAVQEIRRTMKEDDTLFVYATGHGKKKYHFFGERQLAVGQDRISEAEWEDLMKDFPGTMIAFFDGCYGGAFTEHLRSTSANRIVFSVADEDTESRCRVFSPKFWDYLNKGESLYRAFQKAFQQYKQRVPEAAEASTVAEDLFFATPNVHRNSTLDAVLTKFSLLNQANYQQVVSRENVLISISADWCAPCKKLEPELRRFALEQPSYALVRANFDDEELRGRLEQDFKVEIDSVPALIHLEKGKVPVVQNGSDTIKGYLKRL